MIIIIIYIPHISYNTYTIYILNNNKAETHCRCIIEHSVAIFIHCGHLVM